MKRRSVEKTNPTPNDGTSASIGSTIRDFRNKIGMTQVQFASALAITPTSVYRYEAGTNSPTDGILAKLLSLAVQRQALDAVQSFADALALRTGLTFLENEDLEHDSPLARAVSSLGLEQQRLVMSAVLMLQENADRTAIRVFDNLLQPWVARASEAFGPLGVSFRKTERKSAKEHSDVASSTKKI